MKSIVVVTLAILSIGPVAESSAAQTAERFEVQVGDLRRIYLLETPTTAGPGPLPVLIAFHGGGGNADQFREGAGLTTVAEREGFLVVYPFGTGPFRDDRVLTWNAGSCCGYANQENIDDLAFVNALLDDLPQRASIDPNRIYLTGHSNGSMMAYHAAANLPGRFAAVAGVGGAMTEQPELPTEPLPVLHIHSLDDPRALYDGGVRRAVFGSQDIDHRPVEETLSFWRSTNGCDQTNQILDTRTWRSRPLRPRHSAELIVWSGCEDGTPLHHWKLAGAGHSWPGDDTVSPLLRGAVGPMTEVIDAAEEVWSFVSAYSLLSATMGSTESARAADTKAVSRPIIASPKPTVR